VFFEVDSPQGQSLALGASVASPPPNQPTEA